MSSRQDDFEEEANYADDFWPGFVDILSGLILIFSFLILVAGIIIAVIYQTKSTVEIPIESFKYILNQVQKSPFTIESQYDVLEQVKRGKNPQVLISRTKQELEDLAQKVFEVVHNYPELKRKLTQEIRFLQKQIRLVEASPPPEGQTEKPRDFKGGRSNLKGADNLPEARKDWDIFVDNNDILIQFKSADSQPPPPKVEKELRTVIQRWLQTVKPNDTINLYVANAISPYIAIAQKDSLRRALFLRNLIRTYNQTITLNIQSRQNNDDNKQFGWLRLSIKSPN